VFFTDFNEFQHPDIHVSLFARMTGPLIHVTGTNPFVTEGLSLPSTGGLNYTARGWRQSAAIISRRVMRVRNGKRGLVPSTWINGPVIRAKGSRNVGMLELVEVGGRQPCREGHRSEGDDDHRSGLRRDFGMSQELPSSVLGSIPCLLSNLGACVFIRSIL